MHQSFQTILSSEFVGRYAALSNAAALYDRIHTSTEVQVLANRLRSHLSSFEDVQAFTTHCVALVEPGRKSGVAIGLAAVASLLGHSTTLDGRFDMWLRELAGVESSEIRPAQAVAKVALADRCRLAQLFRESRIEGDIHDSSGVYMAPEAPTTTVVKTSTVRAVSGSRDYDAHA